MAVILGALMGLAYVLPPGPITVETVRQGSRGGFRAALAMQLGALAADLIYAVSAAVGLATALAQPLPHAVIGVAGTFLLLALGASSLRSCRHGRKVPESSETSAPAERSPFAARHAFLVGLGLSFINPYSVLFWLSADSVLLGGDHRAAALALTTFYVTVTAWGIVLALAVSCSRSLLSGSLLRLTAILSGLVFLASGLSLVHGLAL